MAHIQIPETEISALDEVIDKVIALATGGRRLSDHQLVDSVRRSMRFTGAGIVHLYETKWRLGVRTPIFEQIEEQLRLA